MSYGGKQPSSMNLPALCSRIIACPVMLSSTVLKLIEVGVFVLRPIAVCHLRRIQAWTEKADGKRIHHVFLSS